ncbi:hypothetical protein ACFL2M_02450 [Patescibacteria group bacterium]
MSSNKGKNTSRTWPYYIILIFFIIAFWAALEISSPRYYLYDDNATYYLPTLDLNWDALTQGHTIPQINFSLFAGTNHIGQGQTSVFYPASYIASFLSVTLSQGIFWSVDILFLLDFIIGGVGMLLLMKRLGVPIKLGLLATCLFISSPFLILTGKSWFIFINLIALLPWNYLALLHLNKKANFSNAVILGAVKALAFFAGHPQIVVILIYTEFLFLFFYCYYPKIKKNITQPWIGRLKNLKSLLHSSTTRFTAWYLFSFLAFLCFAAPQLLPVYNALQESAIRAHHLAYTEILTLELRLSDFLLAQLPISSLIQEKIIFDSTNVIYFMGPTLLLSLFFFQPATWESPLRKKISSLASSALAALILSTTIYSIIMWLPLINRFRWPIKHYPFFLFFLFIAFALAVHATMQKLPSRFLRGAIYSLFTIALAANIFVCLYFGKGGNNTFMPYQIDDGAMCQFEEVVDTHLGRFAGVGNHISMHRNLQPKDVSRYLMFNFASLCDYYHLSGYNLFGSKLDYAIGMESSQNLLPLEVFFNQSQHMDDWSVRYIITPDDATITDKLKQNETFTKILNRDHLSLYENENASPLFYLSSKPRQSLAFEQDINTIRVYAETDGKEKLVTMLAPRTGYRYKSDIMEGYEKIEITPEMTSENAKPIAINIPANTRYVDIAYRDDNLVKGLLIFGAFSLVSIFIYLKKKIRKK